VLVLEDDAEVRAALRITLEEWGCYVVAAADDDDARAQRASGRAGARR